MPATEKYRVMRVMDCAPELEGWRQSGIVLLTGSLISTYHPTSLPIGAHITETLWDLIFGGLEPVSLVTSTGKKRTAPAWLRNDFSLLPFEALMQCYPDRASLPKLIRQMFEAARPNLIHEKLVAKLLNGFLSGIITPNYDTALETCVARNSAVTIITTESEAKDWLAIPIPIRPPAIFKIHGTAQVGLESTLVYDLEAEGRLCPWKQDVLKSLIRGRTLVVMGYSGRDFDICPELADEELNVVWLQRSTNLQARAAFVLEKLGGLLLIGDIWDFVGVLTGEPMPADQPNMGGPSKFVFGTNLVSQWGRQILDWMACSTLMEELAPEPSWDQSRTLVERASILGHAGRYLDACQALQKVTKDTSLSREEIMTAELRAAEQWFVYGRYWRGWRMLRRVEVEHINHPKDSDLQVMAAELRLFMHTAPAFFAQRFRVRLLSEYIQRKSAAPYNSARRRLENGAWRRLALLRQHAEQIGIPQISGLELPSAQGFASLGFVQLDVVSKRDFVRSGAMTQEKYKIALDCIEKSEQYGWHPEAWKFHWILFCRGHDPIKNFIGWTKHFWKTQYPFFGRILQLLNNLPRL